MTPESGTTISYTENTLILEDESVRGLIPGDKIRFVRTGCNGIWYSDTTEVLSVNENVATIKRFSDNVVNTTASEFVIRKFPNEPRETFLKLNFYKSALLYNERESEDCSEIKELVSGNYEYYNKTKKRCTDDVILYEDCFLYEASGVDSNNRYVFTFDSNLLNQKITLKVQYENNLGNSGTGWHREGDFICLDNCIIPVGEDGRNRTDEALWIGSRAVFDVLSGNNIPIYVCHEDERFYYTDGGEMMWRDNVELFVEESDIKINAFIPQQFDRNLNQKQELEEKLFVEKNKIIDYEKQIFYPVFENNNDLKDIQSITYKLHFRERGEIIDEKYVLSEEWKIKDGERWNNTSKYDADLLKYLGFNEDDIYYQKKKVGMSFIRMSLYDNKDRKTQNLLGYSTIFMNPATFYKRYITKRGENPDINPMDDENEPRIEAAFTCTNKYNMDASSEGFYFYLFPSILDTQEIEHGYSVIYMKVEFNNAKYGKTVPFVVPDKNTDEPRDSYVTVDSNDSEYVDMPALFEDMYLKIYLKFDNASNRYVWRFADCNDFEIIINLFEPRVNG